MSNINLYVERVPGYDDMVRIPLSQSDDLATLINAFTDILEACFKDGYFKIIVDLKDLPYPSSSLIAILIEATTRARRYDGDVMIANANRTAKNNLATFSALSYLNVDGDHTSAFGKPQPIAQTAELRPKAQLRKKVEPPAELEIEPVPHQKSKLEFDTPSDDISEPPFVDKLDDSSFEELIPVDQRNSKNLRVKSMPQYLYTICDFVTSRAESVGFNSKEVGKIKIAVYEACLNVIEHAYHSNPDNWIDVWVESDARKFTTIIQDYGVGFGEFSFKDYNVLSAMDSRKTGGFGLYIIRRSMDEIDYKSDKVKGNRLTLTKYIKQILE